MKKNISIYISKKLLEDIERNIKGKSRSVKLEKMIILGYQILTEK